MHDWTRVGAYVYHDFHTLWLIAICRTLNRGLLPGGYYSLISASSRRTRPSDFRQKRLTIRHTRDDRLRAVVELRSTGTKSADRMFISFAQKVVRAVHAGVHVLVVDPFPPGPNGVHGVV